jgi:hypothetical protein
VLQDSRPAVSFLVKTRGSRPSEEMVDSGLASAATWPKCCDLISFTATASNHRQGLAQPPLLNKLFPGNGMCYPTEAW